MYKILLANYRDITTTLVGIYICIYISTGNSSLVKLLLILLLMINEWGVYKYHHSFICKESSDNFNSKKIIIIIEPFSL